MITHCNTYIYMFVIFIIRVHTLHCITKPCDNIYNILHHTIVLSICQNVIIKVHDPYCIPILYHIVHKGPYPTWPCPTWLSTCLYIYHNVDNNIFIIFGPWLIVECHAIPLAYHIMPCDKRWSNRGARYQRGK
jgi:hypothetical protein